MRWCSETSGAISGTSHVHFKTVQCCTLGASVSLVTIDFSLASAQYGLKRFNAPAFVVICVFPQATSCDLAPILIPLTLTYYELQLVHMHQFRALQAVAHAATCRNPLTTFIHLTVSRNVIVILPVLWNSRKSAKTALADCTPMPTKDRPSFTQ